MTFRVAHQPPTNPARCPYRVVVKATGREIGWINQYLDYETLRRLTDNTLRSYAHTSCCTFSVGGKVFITPTRLPKILSRNQRCSTTCDFNPVCSLSCLAAPLTSALPSSIKPYATYSLMLLNRLLRDSSRLIGNVHPWVSAGRGSP